jgi:cytochrome bd ubiquinol oxidase subunit II
MLVSLIVYTLSGGADFGGGMWDLFAFGKRAKAQRQLIEDALSPIWEANHVWLIFLVVLLFSAFPLAFSVISVALHVPLTLLLLCIVLRGASFVFRHYGAANDLWRHRYGRFFAVSSLFAPFFLGASLGAIAAGTIRVENELPTGGFFASWTRPFPVSVGIVALFTCAYLAAVYLACEARDPELQDDFRRRALVTGIALAPIATWTMVIAERDAFVFRQMWLIHPLSPSLEAATVVAALTALVALGLRRFALARAAAALQVAFLLIGFALAHYPVLVAPDLTFANTAAPDAVLRAVLITAIAGAVILVPSLSYLFRVFKR